MTSPPLGAQFVAGAGSTGWHRLVLPAAHASLDALRQVAAALDSAGLLSASGAGGPVELEAADWWLPVRDLRAIDAELNRHGFRLWRVSGSNRRTLVAAAAIGLETHRFSPSPASSAATSLDTPAPLQVHRGTLRSGDHLQSEGSVLQLGDVNPGARITAGGHVLVWGRLRGSAHAGSGGDERARIMALQLRPLQLRIAAAVARGPEGSPPAGLAEQASLVDGVIRLDPAPPQWPLAEPGRADEGIWP